MNQAESKLDILNLALDALGQDIITANELAALTDDNVIVLNNNYDVVRLGLIRQFPFEFCTDQLPLAKIDPDGMILCAAGTASAQGAFRFESGLFTHETADVRVSGSSGAWTIGNAAGDKTYYSSTDEADSPWDVAAWTVGADGTAPVPKIYPGTPRGYEFLYKLPPDCVTPWGIWNPASRKVDDKIRFKPFKNGYLATDQDNAVLNYAFDNDDVSSFDALFIQVFALALAARVYVKVKGNGTGRKELMMELSGILGQAKNIDAGAQHEDATQTTGRRYIDL